MSKGNDVDHGVDDRGYEYQEEFVENSRGMRLFTCRWLPKKIKALVFMCHGYAVECSVTMRGTGVRLAQAGYAVYGVDYEGHGKSEGLQGYVPSFDALVHDCDQFFSAVASDSRSEHLPRFLLGESMGGALALLLHRARPSYWTGAVLVAPMCKGFAADRRGDEASPGGCERSQGDDEHHTDVEDRADDRRDRRRLQDAGEEGRDPGEPLLLQGQAAPQDRLRAAHGQPPRRGQRPQPGLAAVSHRARGRRQGHGPVRERAAVPLGGDGEPGQDAQALPRHVARPHLRRVARQHRRRLPRHHRLARPQVLRDISVGSSRRHGRAGAEGQARRAALLRQTVILQLQEPASHSIVS